MYGIVRVDSTLAPSWTECNVSIDYVSCSSMQSLGAFEPNAFTLTNIDIHSTCHHHKFAWERVLQLELQPFFFQDHLSPNTIVDGYSTSGSCMSKAYPYAFI